jgi:phasin
MDNELGRTVDTVSDLAKASENFAKSELQQATKFDVPERAREYVQKTAEIVKEHTTELHASAGKVTQALEGRLVEAIADAARISRDYQQALFRDAEAFWSHVQKMASAKNVNEAFEQQSAFLRERGETAAARARTAGEFIGKFVNESAKAVQDNFSKAQSLVRKAA